MISELYNKESIKENAIKNKVKILIADDHKPLCDVLKNILSKYNELEVIGIANTDEEEILKIENLKPNVVITDIKRNNKYTGLDIIKQYSNKEYSPYFFIISSEINENELKINKIIGHMRKPFLDYDKMVEIISKVNL